MKSTDPIAVMRRADPAAGVPDGPLDSHAENDLARLRRGADAAGDAATVTGLHLPLARRRTVLIGAAAVTAATAMGAGLNVVDPFGAAAPAMAATPPILAGELQAGRPGGQALLALAAVAERDISVPGDGAGPHSVHTESWSLSTRVDGRQVKSAVIPEISELIWHPDRSGRLTVRAGRSYFPDSRYQESWRDSGSPGAAGTVLHSQTWATGQYTPMFPGNLPADLTQLLRQLSASHPIDQYGSAELIVAIRDLYREQLPGPAVRGGLLRLLAHRPDVVALGPIIDRAGRPISAFSVDSSFSGLPTRYILGIEPTTGRLLAAEEILTKDAGKLAVPVPSVLSYTLFDR